MVRALGYKRPFADSARAVTARALVVNARAQEHNMIAGRQRARDNRARGVETSGSARAVTARALV